MTLFSRLVCFAAPLVLAVCGACDSSRTVPTSDPPPSRKSPPPDGASETLPPFNPAAPAPPFNPAPPAPPFNPAPPAQRGAALGLYSEDPSWSYRPFLKEMKGCGVSHVALVVPWYIKTARDHLIFAHPKFTVPHSTLERTILDAGKEGLEVTLFPILRVEDKSDGGWRGVLAPRDLEGFFRSYEAYIMGFARIAAKFEVPIFSVGSELASMEVHHERWRKIIRGVRKVYGGKLLYSANWDHYEHVSFWDALDFVGVTGYFELAKPGESPTVRDLSRSWKNVQRTLVPYVRKQGKPLVLTEVGYLSQKDAAAHPWKEGADLELDMEIQRRCYEAFVRSWNGNPDLRGVYFWNWFGWGGTESKEYTPRGKPAEKEVAKWYL